MRQMGMHDGEESDEEIFDSDQFKSRHGRCTDIPCCCVWIASLVGFVFVFGYGLKNGNPNRLHHGIDNLGRVCGVDAGVELLPYTYFCASSGWVGGALSAAGLSLDNPVCVAACPISANETDEVIPATVPVCELSNFTALAYKTLPKMNYCFPDSVIHKTASNAMGEAISGFVPTVMKISDSILLGWPIYVAMFFIAIFLGYAYLCCLKMFAKPMVYLAILVAFLAFSIIGGWMIYQAPTVGTNEVMQANFGKFATTMTYVIGSLSLLGAVGIAALMCCCHSQIDYAVIAIQMTTDVMAYIPSLLFAPIVKAIVKMFMLLIMLVGFVYLLSVAQPQAIAGSAMARTFEYTDYEWFLVMFYVFMFGWIMAFLTAVYQFSIAYSTADYFYAASLDYDGERDVACCSILEGLCVGLMWHQGSFALGSAIIAVFSFIQRVIEYIEASNKDPSGRSVNPCITILTCCCMCCVTTCKSCAEFINKNAYIGMAIKGNGFCASAKNAMHVMIENAAGMAILNGATFVFQIAGMLLITSLCVLIADLICQFPTFKEPESTRFLTEPTIVVVVCGLIGLAMSKIFMDVFDMVSDTLMFCLGLEGWNPSSQKVPQALKQACEETEGLRKSSRSFA